MIKTIIGLLLVAAVATGAYFYFGKKKPNEQEVSKLNKELLIGKWKTNTIEPADSTVQKINYDFQKDGIVLRSLSDTVKADTAYFSWDMSDALVFKTKASDSTGTNYSVVKLAADTLQLQATNKTTITLVKSK